MKRRRPALLLLVVLAAVGVDAEARRAPGPGGGVVVSVSTELMPAVIEAHVFAPLLVPRDSAALEAPPLAGAPDHASSVVSKSGSKFPCSVTFGPAAARTSDRSLCQSTPMPCAPRG